MSGGECASASTLEVASFSLVVRRCGFFPSQCYFVQVSIVSARDSSW